LAVDAARRIGYEAASRLLIEAAWQERFVSALARHP
jgi:hypothetical protein